MSGAFAIVLGAPPQQRSRSQRRRRRQRQWPKRVSQHLGEGWLGPARGVGGEREGGQQRELQLNVLFGLSVR